eukprot:Phypoly_transcript_05673.p1 GENE.Phypoly_transcript_05673~~Phypoly_transcript_05673.p1  ORF type:complete len:558 (+),score=105.26 Phypoly_transcript_05673:138-1811(+)
MNHRQEFKIFHGNANPSLAAEITRFLHINMGKSEVGKFSNGETSVVIHESVRSQDVYIVQPTCPNLNQINFIKHAKANSNSSLNTSIRSPKLGHATPNGNIELSDLSLEGPLVKAPSYTTLRTSPGGITGGINTLPLGLSNPLLSNLKDGESTGFFSPELGPLRFEAKAELGPAKADGKPVPNIAPPVAPNPQPSTPAVPATPPQQNSTTPTTPAQQTTPNHAQPHTPTHAQPSTPQSQAPPTTTTTTTTPHPPLALNGMSTPQGQTTPTTKALKSPRSVPASPSEREKLVISHSSSKDSDRYNWSANDSLMELLVMGDAFKRASCRQLIAVIPFFGYARQSKKHKSRTPITAKLVANMLQTAGFDRVITLDLHASQIQGFFDIPVDNLYAEASIVKYIKKRISGDKIVVSPGAGGVKRAKSVADKLGLDLAILHKEVDTENHVKKMVLVGDVKDKVALIIDDIADTCETLERATYSLLEKGAAKVYALVTHGVLSDRAIERLIAMPLTELVITNSIPNDYNLSQCSKIKVINIGPLLGEAIRRTNFGESLSTYFFS